MLTHKIILADRRQIISHTYHFFLNQKQQFYGVKVHSTIATNFYVFQLLKTQVIFQHVYLYLFLNNLMWDGKFHSL